MQFVTIDGRRYAQFEHLGRERGLRHAFCTRPADVSPRVDDRQDERAERRRQMASDLGLEAKRLHYCMQVHERQIAVVPPSGCGGPLEECDGAVTAGVGIPLMTFSADCPLVLVYDPKRRVLGLAHASWRCTVVGLSRQLVERMGSQFGCEPQDLQAGIGPGAGPCCYEVQDDVYQAAAELPSRASLFVRREGRLCFDLWQANRVLLCAAGLAAENIETAGLCTMCHSDEWYSSRREGPGCGHFGLMAALVEPAP